MKTSTARSLIRSLLILSFAWVALLGACAWLTYPTIGPIAATLEPNPFWSVDATGVASMPFRVELKKAWWLTCTLAPVLTLWTATALFAWRFRRNG